VVDQDETIQCIVCSREHGGRAGSCQEQPSPSSPQKTKPLGSVLERLVDAFRGQGPGDELDGRKTSAPLTTVKEAHDYESVYCTKCGWLPPDLKAHSHDDA
jgi:hypothetical protein